MNVLIQINGEDQDMSFGRDGVVVFVSHGGTYVRVRKCRLQIVNNTYQKDVVAASNNTDTDQPLK